MNAMDVNMGSPPTPPPGSGDAARPSVKCSLIEFKDVLQQDAFHRQLCDLLRASFLTDVTLSAGQLNLRCHRVVLAAASPYFRAMFMSGMEEAQRGVVVFKEMEESILQQIVDYIYSTTITINAENVQQLVQCSNIFQFDALKSACEDFLLKAIEPSSVFESYRLADLYQLKSLKRHARQSMLSNFKEMVQIPQFMNLSTEDLIEYISDDDLDVQSEDIIFDAVMKWVEYSLDEREPALPEVMSHVRLSFCTRRYFYYVVSGHQLLQETCMHYIDEALRYQLFREDQDMCTARNRPRRSYAYRRHLLIIGGVTGSADTYRENDVGLILDPGGSYWSTLMNLPKAQALISVTAVPGGILVTGGYTKGRAMGDTLQDCWVFTTRLCEWKPYPPLNQPRHWHRMTTFGDHIYSVGGRDQKKKPLDTVEVSHFTGSQTWQYTVAMLKALSRPMVVAHRQQLYVLGGMEDENRDLASSAVQCYDPVWGEWTRRADLPEPCGLGAAVTHADKIFVVGGDQASCMAFYPDTNAWTMLSRPEGPQILPSAVVWKGRILLAGGRRGKEAQTRIQDIEEYDPGENIWSKWNVSLPEPMSSHYMVCMDS